MLPWDREADSAVSPPAPSPLVNVPCRLYMPPPTVSIQTWILPRRFFSSSQLASEVSTWRCRKFCAISLSGAVFQSPFHPGLHHSVQPYRLLLLQRGLYTVFSSCPLSNVLKEISFLSKVLLFPRESRRHSGPVKWTAFSCFPISHRTETGNCLPQ